MARIIKQFSNNVVLEFDRGGFNDWCVYLSNSQGKRWAPLDTDYFLQLKDLAVQYGVEKVYNDFVVIYDLTGTDVEQSVLEKITILSNKYDNSESVDILFTTLYMGMIAEENRENTRLGKRIKRLGVHKLLMENYDAEYAANFMRNMNWRDIDDICKTLGF